MVDQATTSYDELPYINKAFPQTHPDRLATLARLFGLQPPALDTCRVLELGCASGDNLIPMAVAAPGAHFVGVDLSARQIERGRATIAALGLANIELRQADIAGIGADHGTFDYIIAHGIYSWVPAAIRDKVLSICRTNLAPDGVAYVSYNTLPGWSTHGLLREMMLYDARDAQSASERVRRARAMLDTLATAVPANTPHGALLRQDIERLRHESDAYLFHDHLEQVNEPVYFHRFVEAGAKHRLKSLAEAELGMMGLSGLPPQTIDALRQRAPDLIAFEQLTDVVRNRSFRQTLLVHEEAPVDRRLGAHAILPFTIASPVAVVPRERNAPPGAADTFVARNGKTFTLPSRVTRAALLELIDAWPDGLSFEALFDSARARVSEAGPQPLGSDGVAGEAPLADELLQLYAAGVVQLRVWTPPVAATVGDKPVASSLARLQAATGDRVTTLLHQPMAIDAFDRVLIPLLDGTRTLEMLAEAVTDAGYAIAGSSADDSGITSRTGGVGPREALQPELVRLARSGLLMRRDPDGR